MIATLPTRLAAILAIAALAMIAPPMTARADDRPAARDQALAPIHGVTFEEWAAGNARLTHDTGLDGVLATLGIDQRQWDEINERFIQALKDNDPASPIFKRYGEAYGDPTAGRFGKAGAAGAAPEIKAKLATFEDYARVQGHLSAAAQAGADPQEVLKHYGLTVYEWTQESGNWGRAMAKIMYREGGSEEIGRMNGVIRDFEAEFARRYARK